MKKFNLLLLALLTFNLAFAGGGMSKPAADDDTAADNPCCSIAGAGAAGAAYGAAAGSIAGATAGCVSGPAGAISCLCLSTMATCIYTTSGPMPEAMDATGAPVNRLPEHANNFEDTYRPGDNTKTARRKFHQE